MIKTLLLVNSLLLCALSVHAQKAIDELKKTRNAYISNPYLSFDVEVYSYATRSTKSPELVSRGCMKKNNDNYYSKFADHEMMINGEKALIVNNESKSMKYYEYKKNKKQTTDPALNLNIDSLMTGSDSIVMREEKNGEKHFTCFSKGGYIRQTEIYTDARSNIIKHILYYYVSSTEDYEIDVDRVEIFYKNISVVPVEEKFFSFMKYFKQDRSGFTAVGKYQGYKVNYYNVKSEGKKL